MHGEAEFLRICGKTRRTDIDQYRRGDNADQRHPEQDDCQHSGDVIHQQLGFLVPAPVPVFAEDGHEGLRKCPFGEHAAQQVGQLERNEEGIGRHARTEHPCDQHIAGEGQDARHQGQAADSGEGFE